MNSGFKLEVVKAALAGMSDKGYFDICTIDACLKLTGGIPPADEYAALRALHCVHFNRMTPRLRIELPRMVQIVLQSTPMRFELTIGQVKQIGTLAP